MKLGNMYDDRQIVLTLVKLLDDPQQPVRSAAFTALKVVSNDSFGYSPDSDNRQAGITNWKNWAAKATAPLLSVDFVKR